MSAKDALNNYYAKLLKPKRKRQKGNLKPEKKVEADCLLWMRSEGWSVQIIEAKATFNPYAGRWIGQPVSPGTPDCLGNTQDGLSVFVEFKAPGRLRTFNCIRNTRQREFIEEKINSYCFAAVVDSVDLLKIIYEGYKQAVILSKDAAKQYLLTRLP